MSEIEPKETFLGILDSYFGDLTLEEGLGDIVSVTAHHSKYHDEVLGAIDAAIAAAATGDQKVLDTVRDRFLRNPRDDEAVKKFLDEFRREYLRRNAEAQTSPQSE